MDAHHMTAPFHPESMMSPMPHHHMSHMPSHPMHHMPSHMSHMPSHMSHMPSHSMNMMPMHPMHHVPMHPMHHMPSHSMNMMTPMSPMSPMSPMMGSEHMMTPFHPESSMMMMPHGMTTMMNKAMHPMNSWMRHMLPREVRDVVCRPMNMLEYNTFVNPIVYNPTTGERMLHLCFDVKGFKPEEVKVEVMAKERAVVVEAKHEVKDKEHNVTRNYLRKFVLPEEVCVDLSKVELKSVMTHDGMLVLESILPRITPEELKTIREKASSKTTPYMPVSSPMTPHGHHAVSIPVKMH